MKSMSRISRTVLALLVSLCCLLLPGSTLITQEEMQNQSVVNYKTADVLRGDFIRTSKGSGETYYIDAKSVRFKGDNARLRELLVRKETEITAGQVIATFEIEGSRAELENLKLTHQRAKERFDLNQVEWDEQVAALKSEIASAENSYDRDKLRLEYEKLMIEIDKAGLSHEYTQNELEFSIAKIEENLSKDSVVAPYDAYVRYTTMKNPGDTISREDTIASIYSTDKILIRIEDISKQIRYNMDVIVESGGRNNTVYLEGKVVAADNILPEDLRTGYAYVELNDQSLTGEDLSFVQVSYDVIVVKDVLMVDRKALTLEKGSQYASILDGDMVKKRYVNVAQTSTTDAWILQGLTEGQSVIIR